MSGRFISYDDLEHSASPAELRDLLEFIKRKLPAKPAGKEKAKL